MKRRVLILLVCLGFVFNGTTQLQINSVAREWNNILLDAIRSDFARPTRHARNLYHHSLIVYDAWAAFDGSKKTFLLGDTLHGYVCPFNGIVIPSNMEEAREKAISYASFRFIQQRFGNSPGYPGVLNTMTNYMNDHNYDINIVSVDYGNIGAAALGNYLAQQIHQYGLVDGANQINNYQNQYYMTVNPPLVVAQPGNPSILDPNRWQRVTLSTSIDQSGNVVANTPNFLSPEWGDVKPFNLPDSLITVHFRDGHAYNVFMDPGAPQMHYDPTDTSGMDDFYKWNFTMVSAWQAHLTPNDTVMWDISPGSIGNNTWYPTEAEDYPQFYNYENGGDISPGHSVNPITGLPYVPQIVPRGDYTRVLAEFWADGINSETPPGHWFEIYHQVSNHPLYEFKWMGQGDELSILEYDVRMQFTLGGALHDAAIAAWSIKGYYDCIRPVNAIRFLADQGQCTDSTLSNYDPGGIPLIPGLFEVVDYGDPLVGANNEHYNKIKAYTWLGHDSIYNELTDYAGVGWILVENWWPYQRPTFVTPPFGGYISGHSTFSRAAAEVMSLVTGSPYFPGGLGEFVAVQNEFLEFEDGPSVPVTLQWATYQDASDQCSLSRIWGGIHPPIDDIPGRLIGKEIGEMSVAAAQLVVETELPAIAFITATDTLVNCADNTFTFNVDVHFNQPMDVAVIGEGNFLNSAVLAVLVPVQTYWVDSLNFRLRYTVSSNELEIADIKMNFLNFNTANGQTLPGATHQLPFLIDTKRPVLEEYIVSTILINDAALSSNFTLEYTFSEACAENSIPFTLFNAPVNVSGTFVLNSLLSSWITPNSYKAVYTLLDANSCVAAVNISVNNAVDQNGNSQFPYSAPSVFGIDTQNPAIQSEAINDLVLSISDVGANELIVSLVFNQQMNTTELPDLEFTNASSGETINSLALNTSMSQWTSSNACQLKFGFQNQIEEILEVEIACLNCRDTSFNLLNNPVLNSNFKIDTKKPSVLSVQPNKDYIADSLLGIGNYWVDIAFSEKMSSGTIPFVNHSAAVDVSNSIAYAIGESYFLSDSIFRAVFTVQDENVEIENIDLEVNFARDLAQNTQYIMQVQNFIELDTKNPLVVDFYTSSGEISNETEDFSILTVFSEPMFPANIPQLNFSEALAPLLQWNELNSIWLSESIYRTNYLITPQDMNFQAVNVGIEGATDAKGNLMVLADQMDVFDVATTFVSLQENATAAFQLFPSPIRSGGDLYIRYGENLDELQINLYTSAGSLVQAASALKSSENGLFTFKLNEHPGGFYFISINNSSSLEKIVLVE